MTLQEWILENGGQRACAAKHKLPASSLGAWCRGSRFPLPANQQRLLECSDNKIDLTALLRRFLAKKAESPTPSPTRRLLGSLHVKDLSRLKRVFVEQDLSTDRCNLDGDHITGRWAHTHVTVDEVRLAMLSLRNKNKDPADVQLIHKTIAEARNAALGGLKK